MDYRYLDMDKRYTSLPYTRNTEWERGRSWDGWRNHYKKVPGEMAEVITNVGMHAMTKPRPAKALSRKRAVSDHQKSYAFIPIFTFSRTRDSGYLNISQITRVWWEMEQRDICIYSYDCLDMELTLFTNFSCGWKVHAVDGKSPPPPPPKQNDSILLPLITL